MTPFAWFDLGSLFTDKVGFQTNTKMYDHGKWPVDSNLGLQYAPKKINDENQKMETWTLKL